MHSLDVDRFKSEFETIRQRALDGQLKVRIPGSIGLHRRRPGAPFHPTPELFLQTGGATDFDCPSGHFRLRQGEVCVMPAGVPHAETPVDLRTPYGVTVAMVYGRECMVVRGRMTEKGGIESYGSIRFPTAGFAFQFLGELPRHLEIHQRVRKSYVDGLITAFVSAILTDVIQSGTTPRGHGVSPLVAEAEKLVRIDISNPGVTVASIAARLGCSPDHLTRKFRAERGMTFNVWINRERVQLAKDLLMLPDHNVAQIGWACGFTSPSYFIRVFRSQTSMTPRDWRRQMAAGVEGG